MPAFTPDRFLCEDVVTDRPEADRSQWISEAGGLTQFGALIETLQPGSRSALKHWHSAEDEMIYVLEGEITLVEGTEEKVLGPGDAATFKAGVPVGHFFQNRSGRPTRCLVVGTRAPIDTITYPDHDRVCHRDRSLPDDSWSNSAGEPAESPHERG